MILLRATVGVELKPDLRGGQHARLICEVDDAHPVRRHLNMISDDKRLDSVPLANFFRRVDNRPRRAFRKNSVATVRFPDSPIVAKHEQRTPEAELIAFVCDFLSEDADGGVHRREGFAPGLFHFQKQAKIAIGFFGEEVGAGGNFALIRASYLSFRDRPVCFSSPFPPREISPIEEFCATLALRQFGFESPISPVFRQARGGEKRRKQGEKGDCFESANFCIYGDYPVVPINPV